MEIKFWLKDEIIEGGFRFHVCTLYKMQSNPFKIGDIINLEMFPLKQNGDKQYFNKQNKLHLKTIKLVEESKYLNIHNEEMEGCNELTIEYHCVVV